MDIDTNSEAYKAGERTGHFLADAIRKVGEQLLENIQHMDPILADMPQSGIYTPSGPVIDSTSMPVESSLLALPERKAKED